MIELIAADLILILVQLELGDANNIIHPARPKGLTFGSSCFGLVMMSVGQIRRLADGRTKLSHQRPVD